MPTSTAPTGTDVRAAGAAQAPASARRPRSALRTELVERCRAVRNASVAAYRGALFRSDLTLPQLRVLMLVGAHPHLTTRRLADELSLSGPAVCALVDRLVRRGYLDRRECAADRRLRELRLTPAGREAVDESEGMTTAFYARLFDTLGDDDLAELNRLLAVMERAARALPSRAPGQDRAGSAPG